MSNTTPEEFVSTFTRMMRARGVITEHIAATGQFRGVVKCPLCEGNLGYAQAQSNKHIHAACATDGCVRWME